MEPGGGHLGRGGGGAVIGCLALLAGWPCQAASSVAVTSLTEAGPRRLAVVDQALVQAALLGGLGAIGRARVAALLRTPDLERARRRAAALLQQATLLGEQVRYDEALRKLESAETAAVESLARLVEPGLLGDIYFQRGIALLPTDQVAAHRYLARSFVLAPGRTVRPGTAPKIASALRRAAEQAARAPFSAPDLAEAARAAGLLQARFLLAVELRVTAGQITAGLFLYDREREGWRTGRVEWAVDSDDEVARGRLRRAARALLPVESAAPRPPAMTATQPLVEDAPTRRRVWPWVATAASAALLISGGALLGAASGRARELEDLAGRQPRVEYDPVARPVEEEGRRYQVAGIVCLAAGAAAGVAALVLWLLPREARVLPSSGGYWPPGGPGLLSFTLP